VFGLGSSAELPKEPCVKLVNVSTPLNLRSLQNDARVDFEARDFGLVLVLRNFEMPVSAMP